MKDYPLETLITHQKNLERILDNLAEGIIAHDTSRRILFFNRAAEEITGYKREQVVGRDCHEAFGRPFCGERCAFAGETPRDMQDVEYPLHITHLRGGQRQLEMRVTPMRDDRQRFVGVIAAFRDVTDLVDLKLQLGEIESFAGIVGRDQKMIHVYRRIRDLAIVDYPVHISGETGTGKELVAAAIHHESRRGGGPFVPVNCAALPEGVLESELFGHVKGAFTGAVRSRKGRFELAAGGTLFLDEVADMPQSVQARLLRVLQEGRFERVGAEGSVAADVRIISATNQDLKACVETRRFREDLYYRIHVVPIHLPPLRERRGDIPLLVRHFLERTASDAGRQAVVSQEAMAAMMDYAWPGNVRELQSAIRFALVHAKGRLIHRRDLPLELRHTGSQAGPKRRPKKLTGEGVRSALERSGGNKAKAARLLGVGRATLYRFLAENDSVS